jgi:hypothetical protein
LRSYVTRLVRRHPFPLDGPIDELRARRFLREHGDELARDLIAHRQADLRAKDVPPEEREAADRLQEVVERERGRPHRVQDLAVDGSDLIALGYSPGPALGRALETLVDDVVENPDLNRRDALERRARELLEQQA